MNWKRDAHIEDSVKKQEKLTVFLLQELLHELRELIQYLKLKFGE